MAGEVAPLFSILGQVKNVDEANATCDLFDEDSNTELFDVRFRPVLNGTKSITIIPKEDTWALAVRLEDSQDWMIVAVGEMDKFLIDCEEVIINDGTNGGLVNWPDAKAQIDKTNEVVQALVNALTGWTPVASDGGAALKTYATAQLAGKTIGDFNDLEDTKVKH
jgi:hypothetical protein